jgi:hypothetical protein
VNGKSGGADESLGHADAQTAMKYQHAGLEQIRIAGDERNREHAELARFESPHNSPHSLVLEKMVSAEGIEST